MSTRAELAADYSARQTSFQAALEKLREHTSATVRLRMTAEEARTAAAMDAHESARQVLRSMCRQVQELRAERDRVWRQLKGQS